MGHWVQSKIGAPSAASSFTYVAPCCELCKTQLPTKVGSQDGPKPFLSFPQPQAPFMVLEKQDKSKAMHVVSFVRSGVASFGRSKTCDVHVNDPLRQRCICCEG